MDWNVIIVAILSALGAGGLGGALLGRSKAKADAEAASSDATRRWAETFLVRIGTLEQAQRELMAQHAAEKAVLGARIDHLEQAQQTALQTVVTRDLRIRELERENAELKVEIHSLSARLAAIEATRLGEATQ